MSAREWTQDAGLTSYDEATTKDGSGGAANAIPTLDPPAASDRKEGPW